MSAASSARVLVVMPVGTRRGGAELSLTQLLRWSPPTISWTVVFLEDGDLVPAVAGIGARVEVVVAGRLRQPVKFITAVRRLVELIDRVDPSLVMGWMTKGHVYGGLAAALARRPAIWFQHGIAQRNDLIDRLAMLVPAREVLAVSRDAHAAQTSLRPRRSVRVVHPGADVDEFDPDRLPPPAAAREQLGLPPEGPIVGLVGRLQRWKGFHVLIAALPRITEEFPGLTAVLVGGPHPLEPGYESSLRQQVAGLDLTERVVFAGYQLQAALWMQAMDVVVHASASEPFGLVVVEAMSLGKPVIAGSRGGPREIIRDGRDGLLVDYEDDAGLAAAILRYLRDPSYAARIGESARRRAQQFSAQRYAESVVSVISSAT